MKRDLSKNVDLVRELRRLEKNKIYRQDYVIRNFSQHLNEARKMRLQLLEEVDKLNTDILKCMEEIEQRKVVLNKENRL